MDSFAIYCKINRNIFADMVTTTYLGLSRRVNQINNKYTKLNNTNDIILKS